jgi:hypothetical protein
MVEAKMRRVIQDKMVAQFQAILPTMMHSMQAWIANGQHGPFPMPIFYASNSTNVAPDINAPIPENPANNAPVGRKNSPGTAPHNSPSISCMSGGGSASILDELDAITVIKRRVNNKFALPFLGLPSLFGSLTPYMFS